MQKSVEKTYTVSREQRKILKAIPIWLDEQKKVTLLMLPLIDTINEL